MRICFLHVPKAGGTAVTNLMRDFFGEKEVFHASEPRHLSMPLAHLLRRWPIVSGHFTARYLSDAMLRDTFVFTFLREPIERVLSQYGYYRTLPSGLPDPHVDYAQTMELRELIERHGGAENFSPWANWQTWIFAGGGFQDHASEEMLARAKHNLEQLAFVGVQEDLAAGTEALLRAWGATTIPALPWVNQTGGRLAAAELDPETRALIEESNQLDRALHEHARTLWKERRPAPENPKVFSNLVGTMEYGSREIEIVSVSIKGDHEMHMQIERRQPWTVELCLQSTIIENNLTVGIQISEFMGMVVYGSNSSLRRQPFLARVGTFTIEVAFPAMPLIPGRYSLTVAAHAEVQGQEKCYHWIENALEFEVVGPATIDFVGLVDLEAKFSRSA